MDFHNYVSVIQREEIPKAQKRRFCYQQGDSRIPLRHSLRLSTQSFVNIGPCSLQAGPSSGGGCQMPPPSEDSEDNDIYKSLLATLLRCPGPDCCADPLLFRPAFFQTCAAKCSVKEQWLARSTEIRYLYDEANRKSHASHRIPFLLDTTLCRGWSPVGAEQPATHVAPQRLRLLGLPRRC